MLHSLKTMGYAFKMFEQYCMDKTSLLGDTFVILRHDVDLKAENSLATAKMEHSLGIQASYFFRVVPQSNKPEIIKTIAGLGHEIGYHYEDLAICKGDSQKAIAYFEHQLAYFRQFYPVKTICMHGSPRSKYDGKALWKSYDYHNYGIIGEPYFDVDFSRVFYLTDTGRRWDGFNVSLRDKIPFYQDEWIRRGLVFHATDDIVKAVENERFPKQLMLTTHPQRWTDNKLEWANEFVSQSVKNAVKRLLVKRN